jgi:hypothetical protein
MEETMQDSTYDPNDLTLFSAVLDRVCADHHIRDDFYRTTVGKRIFLKARTGERRFQALADYAALDGLPKRLKATNNTIDIFVGRGCSDVEPAGPMTQTNAESDR